MLKIVQLMAALAAVTALTAASAVAGPKSCAKRVNNTQAKLLECVTLDAVRAHQAQFQSFADASGGTRAAGTPGYDLSADYVTNLMEAAGYEVTIQSVDFTFFEENHPSQLQQVSPVPTDYLNGDPTGFITMFYSGSGDVTAPTQAVDLTLPPGPSPNTSTSGCEPSDFTGFLPGSIAIIQRGTCTFSLKVANAEAAGAAGVVIFNEGQPGRTDAFGGTLGGPGATIPVVGSAFDVGVELAASGVTARIFVDAISEIRTANSVIAESAAGREGNVIMAGAHLDSVPNGPGIQDNGAGSAVILEIALQMSKVKPRNKLRFAWWGAEESGLVSSFDYVVGLSPEEIDSIAAYLNFDVIASPNYVFGVLDGDNSDGLNIGDTPPGSEVIEAAFAHYYDSVGEPYRGTPMDTSSAHVYFRQRGVPSGGVFTGSFVTKTADEAAVWGGTAGDQYDPCYHLACDTFDNISLKALEVNADAAAFAILQFAMNSEGIDGEKGKGNFKTGSGDDLSFRGPYMAK